MKGNKANIFFSDRQAGILSNPFHLTRKSLYRAFKHYAPQINGRLIDLGCGTKPYEHLFTSAREYIGLDIEISGNNDLKSKVDVFYDGHSFPFPDASADAFFSSETFEHIFNLPRILIEIHRTLKPGGLLLASCPFTWPEHEVPYDFARYTSFGMQHLLREHGFEIIAFEKTGYYHNAVVQLQALYLYFFTSKIPLLGPLFFAMLITPLFALSSLLDRFLPKRMLRQDLYLNNVFLAKKA